MVEDGAAMKGEGGLVRGRGEPMVVVYEAVGVSASSPRCSIFSFVFFFWTLVYGFCGGLVVVCSLGCFGCGLFIRVFWLGVLFPLLYQRLIIVVF